MKPLQLKAGLLALLFGLSASATARAQWLPAGPIVVGDGVATLSGDVTAGYGAEDRGFFDYTDYQHSALRLFRVDVSGAMKAGRHFAFLGELRTENIEHPEAYALYVRIHPWTNRTFDIQVGRVPPTFGAFARRSYPADNPLIGYPLAYQYLTTLRPDSLPATPDELLRKRGLGWLTRFTVGDQTLDRGVPLVSAFRWDTGLQVHAATASGRIAGTGSITLGTVSNPRFEDDNDGRQVAGRLQVTPAAGLVVGASAAHGAFVSTRAMRSVGAAARDGDTQTAWGADLEFSRGYYLVRFESIVSDWRLPLLQRPGSPLALRAVSTSVEGRYKVLPGLYVASRFDHIGFSDLRGTLTTLPWDAPVSRVEIGGGYSVQRNLLVKVSFQHNRRNGGPLLAEANLPAVQVVFWF